MFSRWKFLVIRPDTLPLVINLDVKYSGAWPVIHLSVKVSANVDCLAWQGLRFSLRWWRYCFCLWKRVAAKPPIRETSPRILRTALQLACQSFACANDPAGYLPNCVFDVLLAVAVFVAKAPHSPLDQLLWLFFLNFLARRLRAFEGLCLGLKSPTQPSRPSFSALLQYFLTSPNCCMGFPLNGRSVMMINFT